MSTYLLASYQNDTFFCKISSDVVKFAKLEPVNNLLFHLDPMTMIKYFYCGKMGEFCFRPAPTFEPNSGYKYIKLPHFSLINPFDFANLLHSHNKCSFDKALRTIRDCIEWFTENTRDKIGTRISVYTTQSGNFISNSSLQSPIVRVQPNRNDSEIIPALKDIYDGHWSSLP